MTKTECAAPKRGRRRGRRRPAGDGERLGHHGSQLLMAAGEAVTPGALAAVARSAPRDEEDARSPCECGPCARLLIAAEGMKADGRFLPLAAFFLEEVPSWGRVRRAEAEEALARASAG